MAARCEFRGAKAVPHRPILNPGQLALSAPSLLEWLPDETLYSLCSRQHRFWGYVHAWQTAQVLFGGRRLGTQHDFPSALDALVTRTQGLWGRAEDIATERTLLRFFRPFLAAEDVAAAIRTMRSPSVAHLKFSLGLLTSRFGASHPLKACPVCIREDRDRYGWSYWHSAHQYPGVWICTRHGEALRQSLLKTMGIGRFEWHLPAMEALVPWCNDTSPSATSGLGAFASLASAVVDAPRPAGWVARSAMEAIFSTALARRGWITAGGSLRARKAAESYLNYCEALRQAPNLHELPATPEDAARSMGRLLRSIRDGTHPLRILVAMGWLFGDLATFDAARAGEGQPINAPATEGCGTTDVGAAVDHRHGKLVSLLQAGHSARSAAKIIGIDTSTAIHWATRAGVAIRRRPKVLVPTMVAALSTDLQQGKTKVEVAEKHEVPVHIVTRLLRTQVGLQGAWKRALRVRKQAEMRQRWVATTERNPGIGIKLARAIDPAAYAWLYRNDRAWLLTHAPTVASTRDSASQPRVDWAARDELLKKAVERAALHLAVASRGRKIGLGALCQAVPSLKAKLPALARLPRTRRALEQVLQRSPRRASEPRLLN